VREAAKTLVPARFNQAAHERHIRHATRIDTIAEAMQGLESGVRLVVKTWPRRECIGLLSKVRSDSYNARMDRQHGSSLVAGGLPPIYVSRTAYRAVLSRVPLIPCIAVP